MKFQIVHSDSIEDFQQKVQAELDNGWELHGVPVATTVWAERPIPLRMGSSTPQRSEYLLQAMLLRQPPGAE